MRVWSVIVGAMVLGAGAPVVLHHQAYGVVDPLQVALAGFLWLNVIIALWELCLLARIGVIEEQHRRFVATYRGRETTLVRDFMFSRVPLVRLLSPTLWAGVWSSYSVFDDSYADRRSFGFWVDVGNGITTLVPSLLFLYGMTYDLVPARVLGIVGALLCWQMWYGTVVYLASFFFNKRHAAFTGLQVAVIVGMTNGVWLIFPAIGMYASVSMIETGSYALLRS